MIYLLIKTEFFENETILFASEKKSVLVKYLKSEGYKFLRSAGCYANPEYEHIDYFIKKVKVLK